MWLLQHPLGFLLEMCNRSLPTYAPALNASRNTQLCNSVRLTPLLTVQGTYGNWSFEKKNTPVRAINDSTFLIFRRSVTCLTQKPEFGVPNVPATCAAGFAVSFYPAPELLSQVTPFRTPIENRTHGVPELRSHPSPPNQPIVGHHGAAGSAMGMLRG